MVIMGGPFLDHALRASGSIGLGDGHSYCGQAAFLFTCHVGRDGDDGDRFEDLCSLQGSYF